MRQFILLVLILLGTAHAETLADGALAKHGNAVASAINAKVLERATLEEQRDLIDAKLKTVEAAIQQLVGQRDAVVELKRHVIEPTPTVTVAFPKAIADGSAP